MEPSGREKERRKERVWGKEKMEERAEKAEGEREKMVEKGLNG